MSGKRKITDKNLYDLLEILPSATEQDIKKAYRKKALKCHPDKNPDNPRAAELFHELSEALEILSDEKAREAYDRTLKAKEQAKLRIKELDSKRRKFKEDLERREQAAKEEAIARAASKKAYSTNLSDEESLQKEIERLRKAGSAALREEQELIRQQILKEQQGKFSFISSESREKEVPKVKVKWDKHDGNGWSRESLMKAFGKYGEVTEIVAGKTSAIVEFGNQRTADKAFEGESRNFKLSWLSKSTETVNPERSSSTFPATSNGGGAQGSSSATATASRPATNFADFEAMILGKLSAAAAAQKQGEAGKSSPSTENR